MEVVRDGATEIAGEGEKEDARRIWVGSGESQGRNSSLRLLFVFAASFIARGDRIPRLNT